jgi:hypothetical protein
LYPQIQTTNRNISKFHALRPPQISIKDYLARIARYAQCSKECFVLALVYIDRIIQTNHSFIVNSLNIHRLIITSVMLAAKFFDDQYFNNDYYGKVGGVPCHEMNSLEVEFLFMNNFTLFVTSETYDQYFTELCSHVQSSACGCTCKGDAAAAAAAPGLAAGYDPAAAVGVPIQAGQAMTDGVAQATGYQS